MFKISNEKLENITRQFNKVDPAATPEVVESELCADWHNSEEHQDWLDNAPVHEIVDWLASFYN